MYSKLQFFYILTIGLTLHLLTYNIKWLPNDEASLNHTPDASFDGRTESSDVRTSETNPIPTSSNGSSSNSHKAVNESSEVPLSIFDWVPSDGLSRTVCSTSKTKKQAPQIRSLFNDHENWKLEIHEKNNRKACKDSLIRILWDEWGDTNDFNGEKQILQHHRAGKQLTTTLFGGFIDKGTLFQLIQNTTSPTTMGLKDVIPANKLFESLESCRRFCNQEADDLKKWLWKPRYSSGGRGIMAVDNKTACRSYCKRHDGEAQAQAWTDAMTTNDGRKFDVRSFVLVANLDPLIVFSGADFARICAEPVDKVDPLPFPGHPEGSSFNPFQQICNVEKGKKHPNFSLEKNSARLSEVILDPEQLTRVEKKLDAVDLAVVELLKNRWRGKVGMFQLFAMDYLVDKDENVWLLEVNKQPAMNGAGGMLWPNLWSDIMRIEWEILNSLGSLPHADDHHKVAPAQRNDLNQTLTNLQLETPLRLVKV